MEQTEICENKTIEESSKYLFVIAVLVMIQTLVQVYTLEDFYLKMVLTGVLVALSGLLVYYKKHYCFDL